MFAVGARHDDGGFLIISFTFLSLHITPQDKKIPTYRFVLLNHNTYPTIPFHDKQCQSKHRKEIRNSRTKKIKVTNKEEKWNLFIERFHSFLFLQVIPTL